ncbi:hypothetical protein OFO10_06005 [Campylobacter sp. VBCF_06 NA8]|uniref:hypothetical protein n=1 Tax=Campylobacter sp. VBCF_06 NA8 TaxID=2983822 RepID=UPI0022E9D6EB|nr:hypothetical protein [Campylobacter sp. VBCF_06 NA8]MDA3046708.1 hypothetical protein [Campylobacter sp. VBCF_06 NA8]
MRNLALVLMALLFWGCVDKQIHSGDYAKASKEHIILSFVSGPNKDRFLNKKGNCEFLGGEAINSSELLNFMIDDFNKMFDYDDYIKFGSLYISSEIRKRAYQKGGNFVKILNGYTFSSLWFDLEESKTLKFDIYKCKCEWENCL